MSLLVISGLAVVGFAHLYIFATMVYFSMRPNKSNNLSQKDMKQLSIDCILDPARWSELSDEEVAAVSEWLSTNPKELKGEGLYNAAKKSVFNL
ncbi:MAG: hypothetical protein ACON5A_01915 [Candidatus Comchoanobacterales bacterium]